MSGGDIDVIVNNAGISEFSPITETTVAEFDKFCATNLRPGIHYFVCWPFTEVYKQRLILMGVINIASTRYLMSEPHSEALCRIQLEFIH